MTSIEAQSNQADESLAKRAQDIDTQKGAKSQPSDSWSLRIALFVAGTALLIGFFMPWVRLGDMASISGLELMISDNIVVREAMGGIQRRLVALVPLVGIALLVFSGKGFHGTRLVAQVGALLLVALGMLALVTLFIKTTSAGLWLVLLGAFVAMAASLLLRAKKV